MSNTLDGSTIIFKVDAELVVRGRADEATAADLAGREGIRKAWVEAARKDRRRATRP